MCIVVRGTVNKNMKIITSIYENCNREYYMWAVCSKCKARKLVSTMKNIDSFCDDFVNLDPDVNDYIHLDLIFEKITLCA